MNNMSENNVVDIWECSNQNWELNEDVSGDKVKAALGKVRGVFFVPNGVSLNKRYYPKSLWEKTLTSDRVSKRLENKLMYGKIGHENKPVSEEDLNEGRVSHIVTKLWIDKQSGMGMGEALILDTNAGRNLKTYLQAGSNLRTSSRASGGFLDKKTKSNMPIVDEGNYVLETFDFVLDPGFAETSTELTEKIRSNDMSVNNYDKLAESREGIQEQLMAAISEKADLQAKVAILESKLEVLDELKSNHVNLSDVKKINTYLSSAGFKNVDEMIVTISNFNRFELDYLNEVNIKHGNIEDIIVEWSEYKNIGSPYDLTERISDGSSLVEKYKKEVADWQNEFGNFNEMVAHIANIRSYIDEYRQYGSPEDVAKSLDSIDSLTETLEKYVEIGSVKKIKESLSLVESVLESYLSLGTIEEIEYKLNKLNEIKEKYTMEKIDESALSISSRYGVNIETVRDMLTSLGENDTIKVISELKESEKDNYNFNENYNYNEHTLDMDETASKFDSKFRSVNEHRASKVIGQFI